MTFGKINAITILVATDEGVLEYSFQNIEAYLEYKNRWMETEESRPLTIRTPAPEQEFNIRLKSFDYWKGAGAVKHRPDTPIYDQMMRDQKAKLYKEAYGG